MFFSLNNWYTICSKKVIEPHTLPLYFLFHLKHKEIVLEFFFAFFLEYLYFIAYHTFSLSLIHFPPRKLLTWLFAHINFFGFAPFSSSIRCFDKQACWIEDEYACLLAFNDHAPLCSAFISIPCASQSSSKCTGLWLRKEGVVD